jgi:hopanoid biosynthesis associated RND transporter like protein HpnN
MRNWLTLLVESSHRNAKLVVLAGALLAGLGGFAIAARLGVSTDTSLMFSDRLPWRQQEIERARDFPQLDNLLVAVIDAKIPEEADATAAGLAGALAADKAHFVEIRRPDASPFLRREGLLLMDQKQLQQSLDSIIGAQALLGELAADPSARGVFDSLSLLSEGVQSGQADLGSYRPALENFHQAMARAIAGQPEPLSWTRLLGGNVADLGGQYKFVVFRVNQQFGALRPGGAATQAIRDAANGLEFVKSGDARVRITGQVALADDEFSTVAQGAVTGLIGSILLITLWLFLAVRSWRLIVPILLTLVLGLVYTVTFAALAVGTLNLVSVGFGILFVGIAVDFAIQFCVRYREFRYEMPNEQGALRQTGRCVGRQILVAAAATSAGFLAFVPTQFRGVAELGLIAGVGMIIAFLCTLIFLPALIALFRPRGEMAEVGFRWAVPLDAKVRRWRLPMLAGFAFLAVLGAVLVPRLTFDSDPLHTKDASTEAMRTLHDLMDSPVTNPFTIDVLARNPADAAAMADKLGKLPLVAGVVSINSFMPDHQREKLALISDANDLLGPTLVAEKTVGAVNPDAIRLAAKTALPQIEKALPSLPADHPLAEIADDLRRLSVAPDSTVLDVDRALTRFLPAQLDQLRTLLSAAPVSQSDIPQEISRDWLLPDGRARLQVLSKPEAQSSAGLRQFVDQVTAVEPAAGGAAVSIVSTSATITGAFRSAALTALVAIALILAVALRRLLDLALVMAPLLLSALMTVLLAVLLPLPLNYANIIALPLLLGVGVSFNIYFVMNWRAGETSVLGSATARAILFSALTTGTAFGSLALSAHPGTASMGTLLLISLGCTLVASLAFIPALLASVRPQAEVGSLLGSSIAAQSGE